MNYKINNNNMERKFGALSSSVDSSKLSTSVSGFIIGLSAVIIIIAGKLGIPLTESGVAVFAEQLGLAVGSLTFLYGVLRKIIVAVAQK